MADSSSPPSFPPQASALSTVISPPPSPETKAATPRRPIAPSAAALASSASKAHPFGHANSSATPHDAISFSSASLPRTASLPRASTQTHSRTQSPDARGNRAMSPLHRSRPRSLVFAAPDRAIASTPSPPLTATTTTLPSPTLARGNIIAPPGAAAAVSSAKARAQSNVSAGASSDANHFLTALASQERRVLELKEELTRAEADLNKLKSQWARHETRRKTHEARSVEPMRALTSPTKKSRPPDATRPGLDASSDEPASPRRLVHGHRRRLSHRSGSGRRRTVFESGRHTRALSLLSSPHVQRHSSERAAARAESFSSEGSRPLERLRSDSRTKDRRDDLVNTGKQLVGDIREGLWTFIEDLRQATVGDEALSEARSRHLFDAGVGHVALSERSISPRKGNRASPPRSPIGTPRRSALAHRARHDMSRQSISSSTHSHARSLSSRSYAYPMPPSPSSPLSSQTLSYTLPSHTLPDYKLPSHALPDHALPQDTPRDSTETSDSTHRDSGPTTDRALVPDSQPNNETADLSEDNATTPHDATRTRRDINGNGNGIAPSSTGREWEAWDSPVKEDTMSPGFSPTDGSTPRTSMSLEVKDRRGAPDQIPWPALTKLAPSTLTRTASHLMREWEKSLASPSDERSESEAMIQASTTEAEPPAL